MRRRTVALIVVGAVVMSTSAGWIAARQITSPADAAARTAPPTASPILVPVEERVLSTDIVTRGTARFGSAQQLHVAPSALRTQVGVIDAVPTLGQVLAEGDVVLTASGRPVFLLEGSRPAYRDLGPGLDGADVAQLETALERLGFPPGPVDGIYDEETERAVSAWYEAAGFPATSTTADQLAGIRRSEETLATARLDALSALGSVVGAERDLATAQAELDSARAAAETGPVTVASARAGFDAAQAHATGIAAAGARRVVDAQQEVTNAPALLAAAQADAAASVAAARAALDAATASREAILTDPTSSPAQITAAQTDVTAAQSALDSAVLTGQQSIQAAQRVVDAAPGLLTSIQIQVAADNDAALAEVAAAHAALAMASTGIISPAVRISVAEAGIRSAEAALDIARATVDQRATITSAAEVQLGLDQRRAGVQVPADEVIFVPTAPVRVAEVLTARSQDAVGPVVAVTDAVVVIDTSLALDEARLVTEGTEVQIDESGLGIDAIGVVSRIAAAPGTNGVDGFHVYAEVLVAEPPANLVGASVRLTIAAESSGEPVLAVPISAVTLDAGGGSSVEVHRGPDPPIVVAVETGRSAAGYVEVRPLDDSLVAGDLVSIGTAPPTPDNTAPPTPAAPNNTVPPSPATPTAVRGG